MRLESVQVGAPARRVDPQGKELVTGYGKQPVAGRILATRTGLAGDGQADRTYHGGEDMALLAYGAAHYPDWRRELSWPELPAGGFGENLTVDGVTERDACLGDVWAAGTALLQIASPRKPCRTISRFWGRPELLRAVEQSGRQGWYLRVLREGDLGAGDAVALVERPHPEWTVARAAQVARARKADPGPAEELARCAALSERWKLYLRGLAKV